MKSMTTALFIISLGVSSAWALTGVAELRGTAPNSPIQGTVRFEDKADGLHIKAQLTSVPAGTHAFHIHEFGSCADAGKAAGSHYNPMKAPHGQVLKDGMTHAHAGDLGNITADANGSASMEAVLPGVTLGEGAHTVGGRAVILHEKVDDFSQPVGNAGGRIACGTILVVGDEIPTAASTKK